MVRVFLLIFLSLLSLKSLAQAFGFEIDNNEKKAIIPFESYNNLIVVPVVLNNAIPLKFIVDTGVSTAILTDKLFSDILNVEYDKKISLLGADGKREVHAYIGRNVSLRLPGVTGKSQSVLVLEEDYLKLNETIGTEIHGIIGYELFRRFVVQINYSKNFIVLHEPHTFKAKKKYSSIDITLEDTKPYIKSSIRLENGEEVDAKLLFDTGASHALLLNMGADDRIELPEVSIPRLLGKGLGGDINGSIGRVENISIGSYNIDNPIISFADKESYHNLFKTTSRKGSIGGGLIGRFNVIVDYFNNKLYLKKNRTFKNPYDYNMSGIEVLAEGKDFKDFIVHDVAEDSPGDKAGIQEGDRIVTINALPSKVFKLNVINAILMKREDKTVKLVVDRDGEKVKTRFKLKRAL